MLGEDRGEQNPLFFGQSIKVEEGRTVVNLLLGWNETDRRGSAYKSLLRRGRRGICGKRS